MTLVACAPGEPGDLLDSAAPIVTDVVPTSDHCNSGLKAGECVAAPLANSSALDRFKVDGEFEQKEYANALELPYTDLNLKATGKVFVQSVRNRQNPVLPGRLGAQLFVYFKDIPFNASDVTPLSEWSLRVYVDADRFTGTTMCFDPGDRRYDLSFLQHAVTALRPLGSQNKCEVVAKGWTTTPDASPKFAVKGCAPDPTTAKVVRCSGELSVFIAATDLVPPVVGLQKLSPGIGFGVTSRRGTGAMPEYLASLNIAYPSLSLSDRTRLPTLLFGPPHGPQSFPLKIMSWNVRRFGSPGLKGPFAAVDSGDIGAFLAPYDVVALQEGWDRVAVDAIHSSANQKRTTLGLPPFALHGPIDFNPSLTKAIEQSVGTVGLCAWATIQPGSSKAGKCETTGTHGGLWVLTALPLAQSGRHVYSQCKGEDCFRAKGVQWLRLYLNPPTVENQGCHGEFFDGNVIQSACKPLGSGDHFIDLFNTHLQASGPQLCDVLEGLTEIETMVMSASVSPAAAVGLIALKVLVSSDLNCGSSDEGIRKKQLQDLNAYVASVAAKDRPAIIVGDFNLDGKTLSATGEYATLVSELHLGPPSPVPSIDDQATPWPDDYDWDIDHSDLARTWVTDANYPVGTGTWIGDTGGTILSNKPWAGDFDGTERYDFILFRPPAAPNTYAYEKVDWMVMKDAAGWTWSSPWPGLPYNFGGAPMRYSDHKPVIASFKFAPLAVPGRFHQSWKHDVLQRIASADATGAEDCWTCDEVDLRAAYTWVEVQGGKTDSSSGIGKECSNDDHVSYPPNSCMANWKHADSHDGSAGASHYFAAELWDVDSSSGNDLLHHGTGQRIGWGTGALTLHDDDTQALLTSWLLNDNEPVSQCTGTEPTNMCFLTDPDELGPGLQY
ncbi:MAG: endonuclease/exonuclease/phosphatase family protein [Myxococcales bacterium]|nr:endonuclease/exonuclease/phosphatase family protein [Myxococcales bacterium]